MIVHRLLFLREKFSVVDWTCCGTILDFNLKDCLVELIRWFWYQPNNDFLLWDWRSCYLGAYLISYLRIASIFIRSKLYVNLCETECIIKILMDKTQWREYLHYASITTGISIGFQIAKHCCVTATKAQQLPHLIFTNADNKALITIFDVTKDLA